MNVKKKLLISLFLIISCLVIWFIFNDNKTKEETEKILEKVTMVIKDGTLTKTGATIIITDLSTDINTYGDSFRIDKKDDDKWRTLEPIIDDYGFNAIGYNIGEDKRLELEVKWKWLYGELKSGEYRLVKDAAVTRNGSYIGSGYVYVEFTIN